MSSGTAVPDGARISTVVLGYQGFGNVGDEAILTGIEALVAGTPIRVTTLVVGPEPVAAFSEVRRIVVPRMRPNLASLRALRGARVLLVSGGGLLHDHWWTVLPTYLSWVIAARALGLRVAWLGVGVGPLRSRWSRLLAGSALRWSHLVTVRDAASADLVRSIAPRVDVVTIPDPAMFNVPPAAMHRTGVGIIVRKPAPRNLAATDELATALGGSVARLQSAGMPVGLLSLGGAADGPFAELVAARAAAAGGARPTVEALPPNPSAVLAQLAGYESLISVRLHGLILGALAGTPCVTIAYDPKVDAWAARLGMSDYCLSMDRLSTDVVLDAFARMRADVGLPERLAGRVATIRAEADGVRTLLGRLA